MEFSLENFECQAYRHQLHEASKNFGIFLQILEANSESLRREGLESDVNTRICSALSSVMSAFDFHLKIDNMEDFVRAHKWISLLFASTPMKNADHIIRSVFPQEDFCVSDLDRDDLIKFCMLYQSESLFPLKGEEIWKADRNLATSFFIGLLAHDFQGTEVAHIKREIILNWLIKHASDIEQADGIPDHLLHKLFTECSYAILPQRHDIKKVLNTRFRNRLLESDVADLSVMQLDEAQRNTKRPVALIFLENFKGQGAAYQQFSPALRAMRERFYTIGFGLCEDIDDQVRSIFDQVEVGRSHNPVDIALGARQVAERHLPEVVFFPSLGATVLTQYLGNLRLAPLQLMGLGHPATSHAQMIDYVVGERDRLKSDTFAEPVLALDSDALPMASPTDKPVNIIPVIRNNPTQVNIGLTLDPIKTNFEYLKICQEISEKARTPMTFHVFVDNVNALLWQHVAQGINAVLGDKAQIVQKPVKANYIRMLNQCDLVLFPWPGTGRDAMIDAASLGLVGVTRKADDAQNNEDACHYLRYGMPDWLVAESDQAYVEAAVQLIDNQIERIKLRNTLLRMNLGRRLCEGRPALLCEKLHDMVLDNRQLRQSQDALADKREVA